jgi:hypothetical protein
MLLLFDSVRITPYSQSAQLLFDILLSFERQSWIPKPSSQLEQSLFDILLFFEVRRDMPDSLLLEQLLLDMMLFFDRLR